MIPNKAGILSAARSLSITDRRDLIDELIRTIDGDEAVREEWIEECRRRLTAFDRGEAEAIPLIDVFPELESREAS